MFVAHVAQIKTLYNGISCDLYIKFGISKFFDISEVLIYPIFLLERMVPLYRISLY
ncbi:hypothetical protein C1646_726402, partial [Rhizophagus diaphanus]